MIYNNTLSVLDHLRSPLTLHNESFHGIGISHDITVPLWSGIAIGASAACVVVVCVCACARRCCASEPKKPAFERIPLITIRTAGMR